MIDIKITGSLPMIKSDLTPAMARVAELLLQSNLERFENEGYGTWPPRRDGSPATLAGIANTLQKTSDSRSATVSAMNTIHQRGGPMRITDRMRSFFWAKWYETQDPRFKWMALTRSGMLSFPVRTYLTFREGIIDDIKDILGQEILVSETTSHI